MHPLYMKRAIVSLCEGLAKQNCHRVCDSFAWLLNCDEMYTSRKRFTNYKKSNTHVRLFKRLNDAFLKRAVHRNADSVLHE